MVHSVKQFIRRKTMKGKKKLAVLFTAAMLALSLGVFAACADEEHSLSYVEAVPATCTNAGHEAYYLCSHCGKLFADENAETEVSDADVTIAALGHEMTHHEAAAATCTEDGNLEYWSCSRCELNFSDAEGTKEIASVAIPAGHDIGWVELVEPTASAEGVLAHYERPLRMQRMPHLLRGRLRRKGTRPGRTRSCKTRLAGHFRQGGSVRYGGQFGGIARLCRPRQRARLKRRIFEQSVR